MNRAAIVGLILLVGGGLGCGGPANLETAGTPALSSSCTGSLSGASALGIVGCGIAWSVHGDMSRIAPTAPIQLSDNTHGYSLEMSCITTGMPHVGTFDSASCDGLVFVAEMAGANGACDEFMSSWDKMDGGHAMGSARIVITSIEAQSTGMDGSPSWLLHGSAIATMSPPPGAMWSGTETLSMSF